MREIGKKRPPNPNASPRECEQVAGSKKDRNSRSFFVGPLRSPPPLRQLGSEGAEGGAIGLFGEGAREAALALLANTTKKRAPERQARTGAG